MISIRPVIEADLPDIARIHVETWKQAYIGQIDQDFLDRLDIGDKLASWQESYRKFHTDPERGTLIAYHDGIAAGFLSFGPKRDDSIDADREIYAVYVLPSFWRAGVGRALFKHVSRIFSDRGHRHAYLWVLKTNDRAISAYISWQGRIGPHEKTIQIGSQDVQECVIHFDIP